VSYLVVVTVAESDLAGRMATMRTWLDHLKHEPGGFREEPDAGGIVCRVEFKHEIEAMAFAKAFGGRFFGAENAPPSAEFG